MKILITKTVKVQEELNFEKLRVYAISSKDIDSDNLEISYNGIQIGEGSFNRKTNYVHISINEDLMEEEYEQNFIDYLTECIEARTLIIY
tara:strand:- start:52 stop:321 length:270 start_codon:yes stop_codon:yes gene_type:complete